MMMNLFRRPIFIFPLLALGVVLAVVAVMSVGKKQITPLPPSAVVEPSPTTALAERAPTSAVATVTARPATPTATPGLSVRLWFSPTLSSDVIEPGGYLRVMAQITDTSKDDQSGGFLPNVQLEWRGAADQLAIYGPGPADRQFLVARGSPPVWSAEGSAPTAPGVYHAVVIAASGGAAPKIAVIDQPLLAVVTPITPLLSGYVYSRKGDLWLTSEDGARTRRLTYLPDGEQAESPVWSPDGQTILYSRRRTIDDGQRANELWTISSEGSDDRRLVEPRQDEDLLDPTWSPDGSRVFFSANLYSGTTDNWSIDQFELATGRRSTLVGATMMPDMSADGAQLAYRTNPGSITDGADRQLPALAIAAADASNERILVPGEGFLDISTPRVSPDGRLVAFVGPSIVLKSSARLLDESLLSLAHPGGIPWDVYVVPTQGGAYRRLTDMRLDIPGIAWLPDSTGLAVLNEIGLYLVPLGAGQPKLIAPGASHSTVSLFSGAK